MKLVCLIQVVLGLCAAGTSAEKPPTCESTQLQCGQGGAFIDVRNLCDAVHNDGCPDRWDEGHCAYGVCTSGTFSCAGICFEYTHLCDGVRNCADGWDEGNCTACNDDAFLCHADVPASRCLMKEMRCDGVPQCPDQSDERGCSQCNNGAIHCTGKDLCIPFGLRCDANDWCQNEELDCDDGKSRSPPCPPATRCNGVVGDCAWHDEVACTREECRYPASRETFCDGDRAGGGRCLRVDQMCDGHPDCHDNFDELHCDVCRKEFFFCDGKCTALKSVVCDGSRDCSRGDDEANCQQCQDRAFMCDGNHCVQYIHRCDGVKWCRDGTDEMGCNNRTQNHTACPPHTRCNGQEDGTCPTQDDEIGCHPEMCQFPASKETFCDGHCLTATKWCDGKRDCLDFKDEMDCHKERDSAALWARAGGPDVRVEEMLSRQVAVLTYLALLVTATPLVAAVMYAWKFRNRWRRLGRQGSRGEVLLEAEDSSM